MTKDLDLRVSNRYNLVALIFFVPYVIFEFPGTVFARIVGPRIFLGSICMLWGVVMIGFGFVTNWHQLLGLRVLLGVFEAGYFPACIYLLSTYYTRCEH
jgi:MFS family permease